MPWKGSCQRAAPALSSAPTSILSHAIPITPQTPTQLRQVQPNPTKFSPVLSSKSQVISSAPSPAQPTRAKKKGLHQHAANPPSPPVPPANPPGHHGRAVTSDHHFVDHNPTVRRGPQPLLPLFVPCLQSVEPPTCLLPPASCPRLCRVSDLTRAPSVAALSIQAPDPASNPVFLLGPPLRFSIPPTTVHHPFYPNQPTSQYGRFKPAWITVD